jgi:nicotinamidase-related amidase
MADDDGSRRGESDRALVVLDTTLDRFRGDRAVPGAASIVRFVQGELRYFRERGRPVVFAIDERASVVIQELTPRSDELLVRKAAPSAFFRTELEQHLIRLRVRRLTLVGLETHTAVLLTAADALSRGYEVVVPDPCVAARDADSHAGALRLLREHWPRAWAEGRPSEPSRPRIPADSILPSPTLSSARPAGSSSR